MFPITIVTAGVLGLIYLAHSARVIRGRGSRNLSLGHGGDEVMERAIRTHANFAEYTPLLLLLLLLLEVQEIGIVWLTIYSIALIAGRLIHSYGMLPVGGVLWARVMGMVITLTLLGLGSITLLGLGLTQVL